MFWAGVGVVDLHPVPQNPPHALPQRHGNRGPKTSRIQACQIHEQDALAATKIGKKAAELAEQRPESVSESDILSHV